MVSGWYYAHGYTRTHASVEKSGVHVTELADSPLPPLEHVPASEPKSKPDAPVYAIGDILNPDDTVPAEGAGPTTAGDDGKMTAHAVRAGKSKPLWATASVPTSRWARVYPDHEATGRGPS